MTGETAANALTHDKCLFPNHPPKEAPGLGHPLWETLFLPMAFLFRMPTRPYKTPFMAFAPDGLALIHTAINPAEADLIRLVLLNKGFQVEYVGPVTTGVSGTSGSPHIYVAADQEDEAREFLHQFFEDGDAAVDLQD